MLSRVIDVMDRRRFVTVLLALLCTATPGLRVAAQQPAARGILAGVTEDSIHGRLLKGAVVMIHGTALGAVSDSAGRFRIEGIPAGPYRVDIRHPFIDTLRIALGTRMRQSTGADSAFLVLSTPSPATLTSLKCSEGERQLGGAMVLGIVSEAVTGEPAIGAEVSVEWTDYDMQGKSISIVPQKRSAIVGKDGGYRICGIPADLEAGVVAARAGDTTAALPANFSAGVVLASFQLSPPIAGFLDGDRSARATGRISGRVVDSAGRPVEGARVAAERDSAFAITDTEGSFGIWGLRPGTRAIVVRRLGFHPVTQPVSVRADAIASVQVALTRYVPVLEAVRITARRNLELDRVGFARRQRSGMGRYITPDEIDRRNPFRLNDLLRMVPSLRTGRTARGDTYVTGRWGECVRYFVDGQQWSGFGEGPDAFISGREIGAVEVHSGMSAPGEYMSFGRDGRACTSVVVWTKWKLRI